MSKEEIEKIKKDSYWKGFSDKEQEAVMICTKCKYRKDYKKIENKLKELGKGQQTLIASRRKWKYRYYKEGKKVKELERLQEENKDLKKANREKADKLIEIINLYLDAVPKGIIKEKIEELANTKGDFATYIATSERIKVLKELLEGK